MDPETENEDYGPRLLFLPFSISEEPAHQALKGIVYMLSGGITLATSAYLGHLNEFLQCCESMGMVVGGASLLLGFIHAVVGFNSAK